MRFLRHLFALAIVLTLAGAGLGQPISNDSLRNGPKVMQAFRSVVAKPSESTVRIQADGTDVALGTVIDPDGWILTKWSEIKDMRVTVKLKNGTILNAEVRGVKDDDKVEGAFDLALLKVNAKGLKPVEWHNSKEATVGRWVASPGTGTDPVAVGVVSVASRPFKVGDQPAKQININAGYLGVQNLSDGKGGAKVGGVPKDGPAFKAGLKADDIIYEAAGRKTPNAETLIDVIGRFKPGDKIVLKIKRGDEDKDIEATLGRRDPKLFLNPQELMGVAKLSSRRGGFPIILQHDSGLKAEDCGGPLVDLDGYAVGINIARAGRTETYALPSESIEPLLKDLKADKLKPTFNPRVPNFTMRGSFIPDDKVDKKREGKYYVKVEEVKLTAGATYTIELNTTDKGVDPFLILEDEKGKELARDDDGGGFPNARIVFSAPSDGTYRIICTTFNPNETGAYTLTVRREPNGVKEGPKK
jgi:serine protease Do